ncbi:hypothetical protein GDO81_007988 [Engystomops pustulosus]|uniref:Uncharacterized protein n=1 Tax=Engystomops pustulosus TaxID=76066 RepID=A0AAV7CBN7_ENGPU|nr:hypothetical protein GDO81_007988 [Engystomops pustulosus]
MTIGSHPALHHPRVLYAGKQPMDTKVDTFWTSPTLDEHWTIGHLWGLWTQPKRQRSRMGPGHVQTEAWTLWPSGNNGIFVPSIFCRLEAHAAPTRHILMFVSPVGIVLVLPKLSGCLYLYVWTDFLLRGGREGVTLPCAHDSVLRVSLL